MMRGFKAIAGRPAVRRLQSAAAGKTHALAVRRLKARVVLAVGEKRMAVGRYDVRVGTGWDHCDPHTCTDDYCEQSTPVPSRHNRLLELV